MTQLARVADLLLKARVSAGLSQGELATKSRVGLSTIQRIEQARGAIPTERIMQKLAIAFGKSYDPTRIAFVGGSDALGRASQVLSDLAALVGQGVLTTGEVIATTKKAAASASPAARQKMDARRSRP